MGEGLLVRPETSADLGALTEMTREFDDYLDALDGAEPPLHATEIASAAKIRLHALAFGVELLCQILIAELDGDVAGYLNCFMGVFTDDATPAFLERRICCHHEERPMKGINHLVLAGHDLDAMRSAYQGWDSL
jgi:hypothetical protein